jgi:hypothetical protein
MKCAIYTMNDFAVQVWSNWSKVSIYHNVHLKFLVFFFFK